MNKTKQTKNVIKIPQLYFSIYLGGVILAVIIGLFIYRNDYVEKVAKITRYSEPWTVTEADGSSALTRLPYIQKKGGMAVSKLTSTLPNDIENNMVLCIRADQVDINVYIDGELRLEYSTAGIRKFGKNSPRRYLFLQFREEDAGKQIEIESACEIAGSSNINVTFYGDKFEIVRSMIISNVAEVSIAICMFLICLFCLIACIFLMLYYKTIIEMSHLAVMGLLASIWILCNSDISQFYFPNGSATIMFDYIMLVLLPFPFLFFMDRIQKQAYGRLYKGFEYFVMAESVFCTMMQLLGVRDFAELFPVIAGSFGVTLIMILTTIAIDIFAKKNRSYTIIAVGILVGIGATLIQITLFVAGLYSIGGNVVAIALLAILTTAIIDSFRRIRNMELERQVAIAEGKAETAFLANMSHEIRTPINAVLGMNEMILRETQEDKTREYAENVVNSGTMLLSIVNDILDFSKIRSGKMAIISDKYSLSAMVDNVQSMIHQRAEAKGLALSVNVAQELPDCLNGDEVRIKQIIINILTNAVKYTEKGSIRLDVTGERIEDNKAVIQFAVTDTGKGIKKEDQAALFDAFSRADEKNNRNIEGTGLGLALVNNLVLAMNGKISVQSEYGKGSCFTVEIPQEILGTTTVAEAATIEKPIVPKKSDEALFTAPDAKVMVVDDNAVNLMVAKGLLKRTLVNVTTATGGPECMDILKTEQFDIIFMDQLMPVMNGEETVAAIRKQKLAEGTPIIALTADAVGGAKERYVAMGFDDYLAKPINPVEIETMMSKYIKK